MAGHDDSPLADWEYPSEQDIAEDDDDILAEVAPCPSCGRAVHDQTQQCPYCKQWIIGRLERGDRWYVRIGRYLTKVLVINWIFWLVFSAAVTALILWKTR